ncbi:Alpha/Beta hydrolase protein [Desarmillaria ectypa]|nr:Alpha/Beta hydrolase protein [Desarmillaria ectypa]
MLYLLFLLSFFCSSFALQTFLEVKKSTTTAPNYEDDGHFIHSQYLSFLSYNHSTTLEHPPYPEHSVRVKKTEFSSFHHTTNPFDGYIDIEARHLFFYFFESRNDPDKDDYHPESWHTNANIFFIDQPIGVGFSYAEYGETVSMSEEAAQDIAAFITILFPQLRPVQRTGVSYVRRIVWGNSVMIGNWITDSITTLLSCFDMQYIKTCVNMKSTLPRCKKWMTGSCIDQFDTINYGAAYSFCSSVLSAPYRQTGTQYIRQYLDDPGIRTLLGVDPSLTANFTSCSHDVGSNFRAAHDILHPTKDYVAALLEHDIKVLYTERWTFALEWSGQIDFTTKELRDYAKGLSFTTIHGAGHIVLYDKPKESLEIVQRWWCGNVF